MFYRSFLKIYVSHCVAAASLSDTDDNNLNWKKSASNYIYKIINYFYFKKSSQNSFFNMLLSQFWFKD